MGGNLDRVSIDMTQQIFYSENFLFNGYWKLLLSGGLSVVMVGATEGLLSNHFTSYLKRYASIEILESLFPIRPDQREYLIHKGFPDLLKHPLCCWLSLVLLWLNGWCCSSHTSITSQATREALL